MLPVLFLGRKHDRRWLLRSVFTTICVIACVTLEIRAAAQTATPAVQVTQAQATQDQNNLPPIRVSGNKPKSRGNVRRPYPGAQVHAAPNPVRTPPIPGNVTGPIPNNIVTGPLAGIPATPLNAVAKSASRLGLPVIETPASVDVVTAQTIQDQG
jgi:iron complex outermembrane receptor protein